MESARLDEWRKSVRSKTNNKYCGTLYMFFLFLTSFFGHYLLAFPLYPIMLFSVPAFRWVCDSIMSTWFALSGLLMEFAIGVKFFCHGDVLREDEASVIVLNHRTMFDYMFFWGVMPRFGFKTAASLKIVLKKQLKWLPGFGWAMQLNQFVFLSRRWDQDEAVLRQILDYFIQSKYPVKLLIFPEGTDFDPISQKRSDDYAAKTGLPKYEQVLHPRTRGFAFIVEYLRQHGRLGSVVDVTVGYPVTLPAKKPDIFLGKFPEEVHFSFKRHASADLPKDEEGLAKWCESLFLKKEANLKEFYGSPKPTLGASWDDGVKRHKKAILMGIFGFFFWFGYLGLYTYLVLSYSWFRWYCLVLTVAYAVVCTKYGVEHIEIMAHNWHYKRGKKDAQKDVSAASGSDAATPSLPPSPPVKKPGSPRAGQAAKIE